MIPSAACDNDGWHYASNAPTKDGWYQVKYNSPRVEKAWYDDKTGDWFLNGHVVYPKVWREIPAATCSSYDEGWLPADHPALPPTRHPVLCLTDDGPVVGYRDCELWFATLGDKAVRVKAWRELPPCDYSNDCCDNGFEAWWNSQPNGGVASHMGEPVCTGLGPYDDLYTYMCAARTIWNAARNAR